MSGKPRNRFPLRLKMVMIVIGLSLILCSVSLIMSNYRFSSTNEQNFKDHCKDIADMAALTVDGDALKVVCDKVLEIYYSIPLDEVVLSDDWGSDEFNAYLAKYESVYDMPEFKKVHEQLSQTQNLGISTLSSVYTEIYDFGREANNALYLVDAAPEEDACPPGVTEHVEDADWDSVKSGLGHDPYLTNTEMYGWLVTAASPVYDSSGKVAALVAVDLDMNEIKANEQSFITMLTLILVSMTAVICIITLVAISVIVVNPIKKLSIAASGYVSNDERKQDFSSIDIRNSDEIGGLSDAMKKMESDIKDYVDNITTITAEKERVSAELGVAAKLQDDMLPKDFPSGGAVDLYAAMTPAKEMGGDFYDFFMTDDDHMMLVMADVSGKGVPAAMFMIVAKTMINMRSKRGGTPAQMLFDVNNALCGDNPSGLFVTAWVGILTLSTGELIFSNAGHEYPAVRRGDGAYELVRGDNMPPLATVENIEYEDEKIQLSKGDGLFLYTDGVPEAKAPDSARFGTDRMIATLNNEKGHSPEEVVGAIKREVEKFTGDNTPFDDVTVMSVVLKG